MSGGLAISLALHAALAATVWSLAAGDDPEPITAEEPSPIVRLAPLEVVTIVEPPLPEVVESEAAPAPSPSEPIAEPDPVEDPEPEPLPEPEPERQDPEPVAEPELEEEPEPAPVAQLEPAPIVAEPIHTTDDGLTPVSHRTMPSAESTAETARHATARAASPHAAPDSDAVDRRALMRGYARTISRDIQRGLDYPSRARQRRIEGTVVIEIRIADDGRILAARIHESSGFELLDRTALQRVLSIERFGSPPSELAWNQRAMRVPVRFALRA